MTNHELIGRLLIDFNTIEEFSDQGDTFRIDFHLHHRPPYLDLRGADAEAMRSWFTKNVTADHIDEDTTRKHDPTHFINNELDGVKQRAESGELIPAEDVLQLVAAYDILRTHFDDLLHDSIWRVSKILMEYEQLRQAYDPTYTAPPTSNIFCKTC